VRFVVYGAGAIGGVLGGRLAEHGHEVYPSDIPSLAFPNGIPGAAGTGEPIPA